MKKEHNVHLPVCTGFIGNVEKDLKVQFFVIGYIRAELSVQFRIFFSGYIRLVLLFGSLLVYEKPVWFLSAYIISAILDGKVFFLSLSF